MSKDIDTILNHNNNMMIHIRNFVWSSVVDFTTGSFRDSVRGSVSNSVASSALDSVEIKLIRYKF